MLDAREQFSRKPHLWLIALVGVIVPRRLRADWRQEWEAELRCREAMLADWDRLDWRGKWDLLRRSASAFWDALWLLPQRWEDEMVQDLRFGVRMLLKNPGFTAIAFLTLALGIGANAAIFSVVNAVLLRPLPYPEQDRLALVFETEPQLPKAPVTGPDYLDWKESNNIFESMAAGTEGSANLTGAGLPQRVSALPVSAGFFEMLRVTPSIGRSFHSEDDRPGRDKVVVLTNGLWQSRFGADPAVLGKTVVLDGQSFEVVGVLPEHFYFPPVWGLKPDLFVPLALQRDEGTRGSHWLWVMGRLKPGVTLERAQTEMGALAARLSKQYPSTNGDIGARVISLRKQLVGEAEPALLILLGAVSFVLLIACANIANLSLSRMVGRRREMALRAALGASRFRLLRQSLTESLLLSLLGGAAGLLLAGWVVKALITLTPEAYLPRTGKVETDFNVLLFTLGASLLTSLLSGLLPAWQATRVNLNESLKEGDGRTGSGARGYAWKNALIVAEVALGLALVIGAGLMIRSLRKVLEVDPGFAPTNVLSMRLDLPNTRYRGADQVRTFYEGLIDRIKTTLGVEGATAASQLPLVGGPNGVIQIEGRPRVTGIGGPLVQPTSVLPDYFRTMSIPLLRGRTFDRSDTSDSTKVVVINRALAQQFWPNENPLGKRLSYSSTSAPVWSEVIGVVGDAHQGELTRDPLPEVYYPHSQRPMSSMHLLVRSSADTGALSRAIRLQVQEADKELPVMNPIRLESMLNQSTHLYRFRALLMGVFGALALLLVSVGIYGVMSYTVAQRTREIGIRMALGAQARDVLKLIVLRGLGLALAGVVIGLAMSLAVTRVIGGLLYGVTATDPTTFLFVPLFLLGVAVVACYLPARKATKVDPFLALRQE